MTRSSRARYFIIRTQAQVAVERENTRRLQEQLTFCLQLLDSYFIEISSLIETLDRLSSLPSELNAWYNKYASVKRSYENSLRLLDGYREQNTALARRLEEVQISWRSLDNLLLQRSEEFHFPYSSPSSFH